MHIRYYIAFSALTLVGIHCSGGSPPTNSGPAEQRVVFQQQGIVAGAGYTTFDAVQGGCLDSPNGINCNNYQAKQFVYMSGGPVGASLSNGTYFFSVVVPGYQNGGFVQGADGNLSDQTVGLTANDFGSGDTVADRTFSINNGVLSYSGPHAMGTTLNGKPIIQLMPYDSTSNQGGVYILAICKIDPITGPTTDPSQCKYDAFRIRRSSSHDGDACGPCGCEPDGGTVCEQFGVMNGKKYYDANANGQWDPGEVGIPNWLIQVSNDVSITLNTDVNGNFSISGTAGNYSFREVVAPAPWMQTGNLVNQSTASGGASSVLNQDKSYSVHIEDCSEVKGLYFGNLCLGAGGGHTLGFWSNKNGQSTLNDDGTMVPELAFLSNLNLRNADGSNFDPVDYTTFRNWLLSGNAVNMAYMLSVQLSAMVLNVEAGWVNGSALIYAPGTSSANPNGFASINSIIQEANTSLGINGSTPAGHPQRNYQEALKNALDQANNNQNFVQPGPEFCPTPNVPL